MNRGFLDNSRVDSLQPVIEPAERLVRVLIQWPVQVNWRADAQFFRALPFFDGANVTRQMEAVDSPIAAKISGDSAIFEIHGTFLMKFGAQVVHDDVDEDGV